jgi:hypothetical protein
LWCVTCTASQFVIYFFFIEHCSVTEQCRCGVNHDAIGQELSKAEVKWCEVLRPTKFWAMVGHFSVMHPFTIVQPTLNFIGPALKLFGPIHQRVSYQPSSLDEVVYLRPRKWSINVKWHR